MSPGSSARRSSPVTFRAVAPYDNNARIPHTHLVRPEAAARDAPYLTVCSHTVIGTLLDDPIIAQRPCPRCARWAAVRWAPASSS